MFGDFVFAVLGVLVANHVSRAVWLFIFTSIFKLAWLIFSHNMIMKIAIRLTSRRSQPPLALSVPLSRFTSRVGGGSAFFVRPHRVSGFCRAVIRCGVRVSSQIEMSKLSAVSLGLARAWFERAGKCGASGFMSVMIRQDLFGIDDVDVA